MRREFGRKTRHAVHHEWFHRVVHHRGERRNHKRGAELRIVILEHSIDAHRDLYSGLAHLQEDPGAGLETPEPVEAVGVHPILVSLHRISNDRDKELV